MGTARAVVAVVALVALVGSTLTGCDAADAGPLSGETWVLTSAVDDGVAVERGDDVDIRWSFIDDGGCDDGALDCPGGPKLTGNDVCNDFTRSIRVEDTRVVWGDYWLSTAAGCSGELADTLSDFFWDESFQYVLSGEQLQLTSSGGQVELTLRPG